MTTKLPTRLRVAAGARLVSAGGDSVQRAMRQTSEIVRRLREQATAQGMDAEALQAEALERIAADTDAASLRQARKPANAPRIDEEARRRAQRHAKALHGLLPAHEAPSAITEALADAMTYAVSLAQPRNARHYMATFARIANG